jgi:formate dehydrogenase major subunit
MRKISRRHFLQSLALLGGAIATGAYTVYHSLSGKAWRKQNSEVFTAPCTQCGLQCGLKIYHKNGKVISVEGSNEHPVNKKQVCPKGKIAAELYFQYGSIAPLFKPSQTSEIKNISNESAIKKSADLIKSERDNSFISSYSGITVNRVETIAALCGNSVSNEEAYLFNKLCRITGIRDLGYEELLTSSDAPRALYSSLGVPAQTNSWEDLKNSDCIIVWGANPSVSSPMALSHIASAKKNGAKIITISPENSETSLLADIHLNITPGTDMYLVLGFIRYLLSNELYNKRYLADNTDASFLLSDEFIESIKDSKFPGFDDNSQTYKDMTTWAYLIDERGNPKSDQNLARQNTVLQLIKKNYDSYKPDVVLKHTGVTAESFLLASELISKSTADNKSAAIFYGGGFTDSAGFNGVRALTILQLLGGNIGTSGGGLFGIHNNANAQGVADNIGIWNMLPGYLPLPDSALNDDYSSYIKNNSRMSNDPRGENLWYGYKNYIDSLLSAWFKTAADISFDFLPRRDGILTLQKFITKLKSKNSYNGIIFFDIDLDRIIINRSAFLKSISNLDWIINITSEKNNQILKEHISQLGNKPEVIFIPYESPKYSFTSYTSSERKLQTANGKYNNPAAEDSLAVLNNLFITLTELYKAHGGKFPDPFIQADWDYKSYNDIQNEISGKGSIRNLQVTNSIKLPPVKEVCGNWLYYDIYSQLLSTQTNEIPKLNREKTIYPNHGYSWPMNSKNLFNQNNTATLNDDNIVYSEDKSDRAFYFNKDAAALLFVQHPEGPFPLFEEENIISNTLQVYGRDQRELSFKKRYNMYNEYFSDAAMIINRETAKKLNLRDGKNLTIRNENGVLTLPVKITDRKDLKNMVAEITGKRLNSLRPENPVSSLTSTIFVSLEEVL